MLKKRKRKEVSASLVIQQAGGGVEITQQVQEGKKVKQEDQQVQKGKGKDQQIETKGKKRMSTAERKQAKRTSKKEAIGVSSKTMVSSCPIKIEFPSAISACSIEVKDIQQVILEALTNANGLPPWLQIEGNATFDRVVMIVAPGIDLDFFNKHKEFMPNLSDLPYVITHPPGDKHNINSLVAEFLSYQVSESALTSEDLAESLDYLVLTDHELVDNCFPLPERLQDNSETQTTTTTTSTTQTTTSTESSSSISSSSITVSSVSTTSPSSPSPSPAATVAADHTASSPAPDPFPRYSVCVPSNGVWVQTKPLPKGKTLPSNMLLVGLDCEMCLTVEGLELTRVSLVDSAQNIIYDKFVVPKNPILNYLTRFSGIEEETLEGVTTDLAEVQSDLLELIPAEVALAGHSLENDMMALKMIHTRVVDTSVLFPSSQHGRKNALRFLTRRYLKRTIQTDTHNSVEDSVAVMDLVRWRIAHPEEIPLSPKPFMDVLAFQNKKCAWVDSPREFAAHKTWKGKVLTIEAENDQECVEKVKEIEEMDFVMTQLHELDEFLETQAMEKYGRATMVGFKPDTQGAQRIAAQIDRRIAEIHAASPARTLMLVTTAHGDVHTVEKLKNSLLWSAKEQKAAKTQVEIASNALTFFCVT